jgi:hypothetical protein
MKLDLQKIIFFLSLISLAVLPACVDLEYDEPPTLGSPLEIEATTTIQELKDLAVPGKPTVIEEPLVIRGVVTANDRSGNLYREFFIQDETAGILVNISLTNAYNFYLIGRELAIDCQGLVIGEDNGMIFLGGYTYEENGGTEVGLIVDYNIRIYRGEIIGAPAPELKTINTLGINDIGRLIQIDEVEFAFEELGQTYADPIGRLNINRTLEDCNGNEIVVRSSGFSTFAGTEVASGNGSIVAIYTVFRDTKQLILRDLDDVQLNNTRCDGGTGEVSLMTIRELRDAFEGGAVEGPSEKKIRGVVISDNASGNFDGRNMTIQDATGGITVRFQDNHNFILNEEVEVIVSGQELSEFNGLLQVDFISNSLASSVATNVAVSPREATVNDIVENAELWESTLVKISNATFSGGSTFSSVNTVSDGSGSISIFTRNAANFANSAVPTEPADIVVIVSQFNDYQVLLRNISDVDGEIIGGGEEELIDIMDVRELFESGTGSAPANRKIRGVVVSDVDNGNTNNQNMIIQDASGGVVVRFNDPHSFSYGEEVEVVITAQELSEFNGLFQINEVPLDNATSFGNGTLPTPREATVQEIIDNLEDWESTVVRIVDIAFTESGPFSGPKELSDGTGTIATFTRNDATFVNDNVPTGAFTLTALVSQFNSAQVTIRNLNDIQQ